MLKLNCVHNSTATFFARLISSREETIVIIIAAVLKRIDHKCANSFWVSNVDSDCRRMKSFTDVTSTDVSFSALTLTMRTVLVGQIICFCLSTG